MFKTFLRNLTTMEKTKLHYLVQVNCKGIKMGTISEDKAEAFEEEMEAKYSDNGNNMVTVLFR